MNTHSHRFSVLLVGIVVLFFSLPLIAHGQRTVIIGGDAGTGTGFIEPNAVNGSSGGTMMIAPYPGKPAEPPRTYYIDSPMYGEPSDSYNSGGYLIPISVPTSRSNPIGGSDCPQVALLCPDGSWAERPGPRREFICLGTSSDGGRGMMGHFGNFGSIVQLGVTRNDDGMRN